MNKSLPNNSVTSPPIITRRVRASALLLAVFLSLTACGGGGGSSNSELGPSTPTLDTQEKLGEALFSDTSLSLSGSQSCATCHNPERGFIDDRTQAFGEIGPVSQGDDGIALGDRNTPTITYAQLTPAFGSGSHSRFNSQQPDYEGFIGGFFHDGRAPSLEDQAAAPFLNPLEMMMPDKASVVDRLTDNSDYVESFEYLFGEGIFDNVDNAYDAMTQAIASFERTDQFAPFDSLYDQFIAGEYDYDPLSKAALGKALFFSQQFTNCATCHQLRANSSEGETFTNYEFHNIGVPVNALVRSQNGSEPNFVDLGLLNNDQVADPTAVGKYKVPTLRNVAITAPYMHNGVFKDLATVIKFYDHFLTGSANTINPETGLAWAAPEVEDSIALAELQDGSLLDDDDVEGLVCFLYSLTDARYVHLLDDDLNCGL